MKLITKTESGLITQYPLKADEAKKLLGGMSEPTFAKHIKEKKIRAHRIGKKRLFFPDELLEDLKKL